jgi:hypothetical protein
MTCSCVSPDAYLLARCRTYGRIVALSPEETRWHLRFLGPRKEPVVPMPELSLGRQKNVVDSS